MNTKQAGRRGGKASATKLTSEQRKERARKAVRARKWHPVAKSPLASAHQAASDTVK